MGKTILIVEDEQNIVDILSFNLSREGYDTLEAYDGPAGLQLALENDPDLILLDLMLPGMDGFEVCRKVRESGSAAPIIMLTARDAVMDKVSGLDAGADDYITKPFAIEELLARIRVIFKTRASTDRKTRKMSVKGVTMDIDRHEVTYGDEIIELNNREYELVHTLMENKNIVLNRDQLMNTVCGYDYMGETNIIDVYVRYIRSKIDDRFGIKFISTVRGVGYVIKED